MKNILKAINPFSNKDTDNKILYTVKILLTTGLLYFVSLILTEALIIGISLCIITTNISTIICTRCYSIPAF